MEGLNNLIADYPGVVVLAFVGMWGVMMALVGLVARLGRRELRRIESKEVEQDNRLEALAKDVHGEESDIKLIESDLKLIRQELREHVVKEEKVWDTVERMDRAVARVEHNMPNGDLKVAISKIDVIHKRLEEVGTEVREHNCEAEGWKRKITAHEVKIEGHDRRIGRLEED